MAENAENPGDQEVGSFGSYVRSIRLRRGLSLRDVQMKTRISNAYLSQIESGRRPPPTPRLMQKLAKLYGVSVEELMYRAGLLDQPSPPPEMIDSLFLRALGAVSARYEVHFPSDFNPLTLPIEAKVFAVRLFEKVIGGVLVPQGDLVSELLAQVMARAKAYEQSLASGNERQEGEE